MHALRSVIQQLGPRNGLRTLILLAYAVLVTNYYLSTKPSTIFMGMYRLSANPQESNLLNNTHALVFMITGLALPLEQLSEYLAIPNSLVYIRQHRGIRHFISYLAMLAIYCLIFTGIQVCIAFMAIPDLIPGQLLSTAICAGQTLFCMLLMVNCSYLLANRAVGYIVAIVIYASLLSFWPAAWWFSMAYAGPLPLWLPSLFALMTALIVANALAFDHPRIT